MVWPFSNKKDVIDLSAQMRRRQEQINSMKADKAAAAKTSSENPGGMFGFFDSSSVQTPQNNTSEYIDNDSTIEQRRRKLAKRLQDMTSRMEDISNKLYHLQQRVELIERKLDIR